MPGADELRRYVRQQIELGETEITLDRMSADQAAAIVKTGKVPRKMLLAEDDPERVAVQTSPAAATPEDWRSALSATSVVANSAAADIFSPREQFDSLESLAAAVGRCQLCALHKTALNPVPGEGSATAELVCVGEGPGATEDETGRPFVGAAGQLLTDILAAIKLKREEVYICNVVKHRPPGNRTPLPDEVAACQPYLVRQIELIKPRVILALGASAAQTLLNTKVAIGKLRGTVHRYNNTPLIVTYHPAALLRNPGWKRPTWEDVKLVRRLLDSHAD